MNIKIAVPFQDGLINEHFGHSENYEVYTISPEKQILQRDIIAADQGCGCKSGIADQLSMMGVTLLLAGNMGAGAVHHFDATGIEVIRGCSGNAEAVVMAYLNNEVKDNNQACNHHEGCNHN